MTDLTAPAAPARPRKHWPGAQSPPLRATALQPPDEITRSRFGRGRSMVRSYPLAIDALAAALLLAPSTLWLVQSPFLGPRALVVQTALVAALAVRRLWPDAVFLLMSAIAFVQWLLNIPPLR